MNRKHATAIILLVICFIALFAGCNSSSDTDSKPPPSPGTSTPPSETLPSQGETKRYTFQNFEFELSNVMSDRTETMRDDAGNEWKYTVITYDPSAKLTVINADMSDATYNEDGKAHPQWGILVNGDADIEERIKITDDLKPLEITPNMVGIYNLEASLYIFRFENSLR